MYHKLIKFFLKPVIYLGKIYKQYKEEENYIMMILFLLSSFVIFVSLLMLLLIAMIKLFILGSKHIGVVTLTGGIVFLYWTVYDRYIKNQSLQVAQDVPPMIDSNLALLHTYAQNGYRDMRLIVFKTMKAVGEVIGFVPPHMLNEIECIEKYFINNNCIFYTFNIKKTDITKLISDEELNEDIRIIQDSFNELWKKGEFPTITLQTYLDNSGVILPPISFCLLTDMGISVELIVTYTNPAYVAFLKSTELEQSATPSNGYDMNDSHML